MTATQAPTPGPLSGDEPLNVLLDRAVAAFKALPPEEQRRQFDEQKKNWVAAEMAWGDEGTRLCLAPTAPVEASGSEREHGPKCWGKTSISDEMMYCYCGSTDLRPQPSGETREVPIWIKPMVAALEGYEADYGEPLDDMHELGRIDDSRSSPSFRIRVGHIRDLALLSARPLALGGQHSSATDFPPDDVLACVPVAETAGEAEQTALNIICDPGIITGLHTAAEARDWIEKSVRAALLSKKKPTSEEVDARRRLINLIEQWDGESEYDAEDIASLADDILHAFNGAPVLSWPALGYVSADAETALKAGINRVIYPAPSAHASFPLYSAPVPAQDDDKLRIPAKWFEVAEYATERGLTVHESNMRMEEFRRVVTPAAVLSVSADEEIK